MPSTNSTIYWCAPGDQRVSGSCDRGPGGTRCGLHQREGGQEGSHKDWWQGGSCCANPSQQGCGCLPWQDKEDIEGARSGQSPRTPYGECSQHGNAVQDEHLVHDQQWMHLTHVCQKLWLVWVGRHGVGYCWNVSQQLCNHVSRCPHTIHGARVLQHGHTI